MLDLVKLATSQEPVDAVAYNAGNHRVRVARAGGEVEFAQEGCGGPITCRVVSGSDPLGWNAMIGPDAAGGKPLPPDRWFELTRESPYPDLAVQILAYFRAPRACDFLAFAGGTWDFGDENHSGHGGIVREDMTTVLLLAGPGVKHEEIPYSRTVNMTPTILSLLGRPVPADLDGKPLCPRGRNGPIPHQKSCLRSSLSPASMTMFFLGSPP